MAIPTLAADLQSAARAYNGLGFQLLAQCRQSLPRDNYFLSPAGLAFALSMLQNGAQGETLSQIINILQVEGLPPAQLNEANKALLDAIYFKGSWQEPFNTNLTRDLPFTLGNGQTVQHPRMSRVGSFGYCEESRFQAVELPYAGGDVSMFVFLPKGGLGEFLKEFTARDFEVSIHRMRSSKGTVELPRFKLENDYDLTRVVAMGMPLAFTTKANFSRMSDEPLYIGFVKQKTYVAVNEEGTIAAAVTAIGARAMAVMREPPPFWFVVDRPFFVAIRENQTGLILFLGAIADPR